MKNLYKKMQNQWGGIILEKIENKKGQELLNNITCAAKLQIAHSRALNISKKAEILFEKSNAGEEY